MGPTAFSRRIGYQDNYCNILFKDTGRGRAGQGRGSERPDTSHSPRTGRRHAHGRNQGQNAITVQSTVKAGRRRKQPRCGGRSTGGCPYPQCGRGAPSTTHVHGSVVMAGFTPCRLAKGADGDPDELLAKLNGFGHNDMVRTPPHLQRHFWGSVQTRMHLSSA